MTPYREAAPRELPTLDIRPEPIAANVMMLVFAPMFGLFGGAMTSAALSATADSIGSRLGGAAFGLPFLVACFALAILGWRGLATKVRFTLDDDLVTIEWRRRGTTHRREKVRREDLVDVGVDSAPSSGTMLQCIVVGTLAGDIPLTQSRSNFPGYPKKVHALATFLGVPVRPS